MRIELDTGILKRSVRDIPDFPKPGILFKDILPLLADHDGPKAVERRHDHTDDVTGASPDA